MRGDTATEKSGEWKATHFDQSDLDTDETHGSLRNSTKNAAALIIRGALRQMVSLGYVSITFQSLPNSDIAVKLWSLTEAGRQVADGVLEIPQQPNPSQIIETLSRYK